MRLATLEWTDAAEPLGGIAARKWPPGSGVDRSRDVVARSEIEVVFRAVALHLQNAVFDALDGAQ